MYQAPFQQTSHRQTSVQPTQVQSQTDYQANSKAVDAYSGDYDKSKIEDDASAQLMLELQQCIPEAAFFPKQLTTSTMISTKPRAKSLIETRSDGRT
jgi:hypothetical protein